MKYFTILFLSFLFIKTPLELKAQGQNNGRSEQSKGSISGKVIDPQNKELIEYATVALLRSADSSIVNATSTNGKGEFTLNVPSYDKYDIKIEFIGYKSKKIRNVEISERKTSVNLSVIGLEVNSRNIKEVEITGARSQLQIGIDKKVYNVAKDITTTGGSATQVLQNVPSVTVDMDGAISLRGSSNVRVLVDGKPSNITGSSRAAILEQIPASSIESIEVITNPSAKYDAEGMAGIINIVLKKQRQSGFNGLLNGSIGTGNKYSGSLNTNLNINKFNFFANYDARYFQFDMNGRIYRNQTIGSGAGILDQNQKETSKDPSHSARLGFDYNMNENNYFTLSTFIRQGKSSELTNMSKDRLTPENVLFENDQRVTDNHGKDIGFDHALNFKHNFEKKGHNITADLLYSTSNEDSHSDITQSSLVPTGNLAQQTNSLEKQNSFTFQTDYVKPLTDISKLEVGFKSSIRKFDVDFHFLDRDSNLAYLDNPGISNHFIYDEKIYSAYGNYSTTYKTIGFQGGLRVEETDVSSSLVNSTKSYITKPYVNYFPSIFLSKDLKKDNKIQISYSRRINRPNLHMLNPFSDYSDPENIRTGNPYLKPEKINAYELSHIKFWSKTTLNTTAYIRTTQDVIRRIISVENGKSVVIFQNLGEAKNFGAEASVNTTIKPWWKINASFNYFRQIVSSEQYGNTDSYSYFGKLSSNFTFPKGVDVQVMGNYRGPMVLPQGNLHEMYFIDLALKKDIMKGKASLSLRCSDVLNTMRFKVDVNGSNFVSNAEFKRQSRVLYFGFNYKINNYKIKERKRLNSQGSGVEDLGGY